MLRLSVPLCLVLAAGWCWGQTTPALPDGRAGVEYSEPMSLPRYMTAEERLLPLPEPVRDRVPPPGEVYCPPEYWPCDGLFLAWESYTTILTSLAVGITTCPLPGTAWIVVDSASEQSAASNTLQGAGADMSRVQFIVRTTDTVWIRDYGPRFIFEDGEWAIIDHNYNRPRPNDNALNDYLAVLWGVPQYDIPLTHGGGNFHLFRNRDAFMTRLILNENPGVPEAQVQQYFLDYQNLVVTLFNGFPTSFDSTQHIDMWMFPIGDNKVIIGQYAAGTGQPYTITEAAVAELTARGYTVYRTPGWNPGGTHYTYTNAVIFNKDVFISRFGGGYAGQDAQALAVYEQALPGYTIHQVNNSDIIGAAGAMHCIVMHVPSTDPAPRAAVVAPDGGETWFGGETREIRWQAIDGGGVTGIDLYLSLDGGATYPVTIATDLADTGRYVWTVGDYASDECRVQVVARDADGYSAQDRSAGDFTIRAAAQLIFDFPLDSDPGWSRSGEWEFGPALAGGSHNGDPASAHTGTNLFGYEIGGDYANNLAAQYLTTDALNCRTVAFAELRFWRWLGVERWDGATVEISNDNVNWTVLWQNPVTTVLDSSWVEMTFDISAVADLAPTVYLRWSMGPTDGLTTYPGWSIDDVRIYGTLLVSAGDINCDGVINALDINPFVKVLTNLPAYEAQFPYCHPLNADCTGDGVVNALDINPFVQLLTRGE